MLSDMLKSRLWICHVFWSLRIYAYTVRYQLNAKNNEICLTVAWQKHIISDLSVTVLRKRGLVYFLAYCTVCFPTLLSINLHLYCYSHTNDITIIPLFTFQLKHFSWYDGNQVVQTYKMILLRMTVESSIHWMLRTTNHKLSKIIY